MPRLIAGRFTSILACVLFTSTLSAQDRPRVFIDSAETVDASNSEHKGKQVDFGSALTAALQKKSVPVTVVTDQSKAQWIIKAASSQKEDSTGTKVAKMAFCGVFCGGYTKFEGTIQVVDTESSAVLFAYNVKKGNFQSAAEAFAKHFKDDYLGKGGKSKSPARISSRPGRDHARCAGTLHAYRIPDPGCHCLR